MGAAVSATLSYTATAIGIVVLFHRVTGRSYSETLFRPARRSNPRGVERSPILGRSGQADFRRVGSIRLAVLDDNLYIRTPTGHQAEIGSIPSLRGGRRANEGIRANTLPRAVRDARPGEWEPSGLPSTTRCSRSSRSSISRALPTTTVRAGYMLWRNWQPINRALATPISSGSGCRRRTRCLRWRRHGASTLLTLRGSPDRSRPLPARNRSPPVAENGAGLLARAYDATTQLAASTGPAIVLDGDMFASVVTQEG